MDWFNRQLATNDFFNGALIAGLLGYVLVQARSVPLHLWRMFMSLFTVHFIITEDDHGYSNLNVWLGRHEGREKSRRLGMASFYHGRPGAVRALGGSDDGDHYDITFGPGTHLIWHNRRPLLVSKEIPEGRGADRKNGKIELRVIGRSQKPIIDILQAAGKIHKNDNLIPVHNFSGRGYGLVERRAKRPLESVIIDHALKTELVVDVQRFIESRSWYAERGVPYRRGYFLEGPPGTGKTSLIYALASHFDKPIYVVNPSSLRDDSSLLEALSAGSDGIVVMEDIDTLQIARERRPGEKPKNGLSKDQQELLVEYGLDQSAEFAGPLTGDGVTLSGLLNAIDGVASREGRILFITSNHPDKLDAALMRPGRIDKRYTIGNVGEDLALEMIRRFYPDGSRDHILKDLELPVAPAKLQGVLLAEERE